MRPRKPTITRQDQAAIYIRVSTDKQVKSGLGLDDQRAKTLTESQRLGYEIHEDYIFIDEGISGKKSGDKRPAYDRMMCLIEQGMITAVIVNDLSRLGRSVNLISQAITLMDKHNCTFISVKESFNTGNAMGKAMLNMVATFAQLESDLASERTEDALAVRGEKYGYKSGQLPYGYTRINNSDNGKSDEVIRVDDKEADIVYRIYSLRRQGISMGKIAEAMNKICASPRGKGKWYASTIKVILDNEDYYYGKITHYPHIV